MKDSSVHVGLNCSLKKEERGVDMQRLLIDTAISEQRLNE